MNASGGSRTSDQLRCVHASSGPVLGLQFTYINDAQAADLQLYAGYVRHTDWEDVISPGCLADDALGCARVKRDHDMFHLHDALVVIWANSLRDDLSVRATMLHELIHALTGVGHSDNLRSIVWPTAFLDLPNMLPYEEDLYRLWGENFVTPGILASELHPQVENSPPERAPTDQETAIDAYVHLIAHDVIDFDFSMTLPQAGCSQHSTSGPVRITPNRQFAFWDFTSLPEERRRIAFVVGAVDLLLISVARQDLSPASGTTRRVAYIRPTDSWYTGFSVPYTVTLDDAGRVSAFTMNWSFENTGTRCALYNVTGSNFQYSTGRVPLSDDSAHVLPSPQDDNTFLRSAEDLEVELLPKE